MATVVAYECSVSKTSNTTFRIDVDMYMTSVKHAGSGTNANKITIKRIEGWK